MGALCTGLHTSNFGKSKQTIARIEGEKKRKKLAKFSIWF
jgi:hypothetical protein